MTGASDVPSAVSDTPRYPYKLVFALGIAICFSLTTLAQVTAAKRETAAARAAADSLRTVLRGGQTIRDWLLDRDVALAQLRNARREPIAQLFWNWRTRRLLFTSRVLPPLAAGQTYRLWFLHDDAVIGATRFAPDRDGVAFATATLPTAPPEEAIAAAVSVEPVGGPDAPTGDFLDVAPLVPPARLILDSTTVKKPDVT